MKARSFFHLLAVSSVLFAFPAACSNDSETGDRPGGGDGDGDGGGGNGGEVVGGDGDGDIVVGSGGGAGDGDGDVGGEGGGDGDGDLSFPDPPECDSIGSTCDGANNCCSGYCDDDSGECSCGPAGKDCLVGEDCCSGQCNPLTNTCVQVLGVCQQEGVPCGSGIECCTLSCVDGFCSGDACMPDGEQCDANGECCSGKCDDGTCADINNGSGFACETAGNNCDADGDCCSGLCGEDGSCSIGASYCVQRGDVCSSDGQCCQGVCAIADGDSTGYCTTQETGGTNCGERKIAGEVCGDDCAECCSRTCAPYGPSGVSICQPATGCRPDGELCRSAADCCGGNPDSSIPGAGQAECLKLSPDDIVGRCKVTGCNPHGAICGSPDAGTAACGGSLSAPNGQSCCGKNLLPAGVNPCSVDGLLIPRCDVLEGCVEPEGECATADDCCNGNPCVQHEDGAFRCFETTDSCVESGGPCTATADCCVGSLCILSPGQATGVCGNTDPPPPDGTGGGNSGSGGSDSGSGGGGSGTGGNGSGTGGGSSGSGGSTSTVCAAFGQDCESHSDCCNDIPCDVASNTCRYPVVR
jgi:hypothetical protein